MKRGSIRVTTDSGIEAVVTLHVQHSRIEVAAEAVESDETRSFARQYYEQLAHYIAQAQDGGIAAAGEPPRDGATVHLASIEVIPPQPLQAVGMLVKLTGGTGQEWTTRWLWENILEGTDWVFVVESAGRTYQLGLVPP